MIKHPVFFMVLMMGLLARFALLPLPGYVYDLSVMKLWSMHLAQHGWGNLFALPYTMMDIFPSYLFYLPFLWGIGLLWIAFGGDAATVMGPWGNAVYKIPALLADLGIAFAVAELVRPLGARAMRLGFALAWLNPATLYATSYWGQIDSIHTLIVLAAILTIMKTRSALSVACMGAALFFKPQSIAIAPLWALLFFQRFSPQQALKGFLVGGGAIALIVALLLSWMSPHDIARAALHTAGSYPYVSSSAINVWNAFQAGAGKLISDSTTLGPVSLRTIGVALWIVAVVGILWLFAQSRKNLEAICLAAAALAMAFFLLPTEMHDRYLYPAFPFLAALAVIRPRAWAAWWVAISTAYWGNLLFMQPFFELWRGTLIPSGPLMYAILAVFLGGFIFTVRQLRLARPSA